MLSQIFEALGHLGWLATAIGAIGAVVAYLHTKRIEYQRGFNEQTLTVVFLAAETVGELVSCSVECKWEKYTEQFWELFWGRLVLFESDETVKAMESLGGQLSETTFENRLNLQEAVYRVSLSLREYLRNRNDNGWRVTIADFTAKQFPAGLQRRKVPV